MRATEVTLLLLFHQNFVIARFMRATHFHFQKK
jgi:hypothetical protein